MTIWYRPEHREKPTFQNPDPEWVSAVYPASKMYDTIPQAKAAITRSRGVPDFRTGLLPYWSRDKEYRIALYEIVPLDEPPIPY